MRCQCSYCNIIYDLKEPFDDDSVSHGICEECFPWVMNNLQIELSLLEEQNGKSFCTKISDPRISDQR